MRQGFNPSQRTDLRTNLRVDPSLVLRSSILSLPVHELEQTIESELVDNPALERLESEVEPVTDEQVLKAVAPQELKRTKEDSERIRCSAPDDFDVEWTELAPSMNTLRDHVLAQLENALDPKLHAIASYLVDSLNERGYLEAAPEEVAMATNTGFEEVEIAVQALQACEPRGIGARNVQECLLLQLEDDESFEGNIARSIVADYLDDLINRKTSRIARHFGVLPQVVEKVFAKILELNPSPADGFAVAPSSFMVSPSMAVAPDLVIRLTELGWEIEPLGGDPTLLKVNGAYKEQLKKLRNDKNAEPDEEKHLQEYVTRAEQFIQSLRDRRKTLRKIGVYLIEAQSGFVTTGRYEFLNSLTRHALAKEIGVHESTMSRATMGKFVQIATGEIVPFEVFFKPALRVQKMIEEILANENPKTPLSDESIAKLLEERGVHVARRTVNKYRDRTRMLNSRVRRSA